MHPHFLSSQLLPSAVNSRLCLEHVFARSLLFFLSCLLPGFRRQMVNSHDLQFLTSYLSLGPVFPYVLILAVARGLLAPPQPQSSVLLSHLSCWASWKP